MRTLKRSREQSFGRSFFRTIYIIRLATYQFRLHCRSLWVLLAVMEANNWTSGKSFDLLLYPVPEILTNGFLMWIAAHDPTRIER